MNIFKRKHRTTADIKQSLYVKKAALIQLTGMAWFVALINDPASIYSFDYLEWAVVCGGTGVLMWLASLNARQAFLSNPDQPDKTKPPEEPPTVEPTSPAEPVT
jgi:hypothetical protein